MSVDAEKLNSLSEKPETWAELRDIEQDISTMITHYQIGKYCSALREKGDNNLLPEYLNLIYQNFVKTLPDKNVSINGLYEKLCYIRDRSVYRPSYVIDENNVMIHISLNIRSEIENLPKSNELYIIIIEILEAIVKEKDIYLNSFLRILWIDHVSETKEHVIDLGYNENDIEILKYKYSFEQNELSFSTYITHLMEPADRERTISDVENILNPLREISFQSHNQDKSNFKTF
jgi:hypothetical protein